MLQLSFIALSPIMPRATRLTAEEQSRILELAGQGQSQRQISAALHRSRCVIQRFLQNPQGYGRHNAGGRPPKLSDRDRRAIRRLASREGSTAATIQTQLQLPVHSSTVRRVLERAPHLRYEREQRQPRLTQAHKNARLLWARSHMSWADQWRSIIWTDEKKFNLDGPDGFSYYWHDLRKEKRVFSRRNFGGGSVMVWSGFSSQGKLPISFINGRMDAQGYQAQLQEHLLPNAARIAGGHWILQQDNASIHTAISTSTWLRDQNVSILEWPACSPDLNIMENMWGLLARKVYANGRHFGTVAELKNQIIASWNEIAEEHMQSLINSLPNRIFTLIQKSGGYTGY